MNKIERKLEGLIVAVRKETEEARKLIVPVSGTDSAISFYVCRKAHPRKTIGVRASGTSWEYYNWFSSIGPVFYADIHAPADEIEEHRWARFLAFSLKKKGWLVSSRNRYEDGYGTYSLASRAATYLPLADRLWKTEILEICRLIGVPEKMIKESEGADLDCGRPKKLAAIPFHLKEAYLRHLQKKLRKGDKQLLNDLERDEKDYLFLLYLRNFFKRDLPIRRYIP